jgi:predicted transglutaminase-like protease
MRKKKAKFNDVLENVAAKMGLEEISAEQLRRQKKKRLRKAFEVTNRNQSVQKRNTRFEAFDD